MFILIALIICFLTYKTFTKWIWVLLPIALAVDVGVWILHHILLSLIICMICMYIVDFLYSRRHPGKTVFGMIKAK